jgi:Xaa-Pro aminopeptidase
MSSVVRKILLILIIGSSVRTLSPAAALQAPSFQQDLQARRQRLEQALSPNAMLILWSAPVRVYSGDVNYPYRQDSNLYYFSGIEQPETILVILPGNKIRKEYLFIRPRDAVQEHWEGHSLSEDEATAISGISTVYSTLDFEPFLDSVLSRKSFEREIGVTTSDYDTFFTALQNSAAQIAVVGPPPGVSGTLPESYAFVNKLRERFAGLQMRDVSTQTARLRLIKTDYEQRMLEESARISGEAHREGMKVAKPGVWEYQVQAAMEYIFRKDGAIGWGYPSIVASGPNATTLHYEASTRQMKPGELLLVDAAANYKYLTTDITRTYPIDGKFSGPQKDIYELVLRAQDEGVKAAVDGATLRDVHQKTAEVIRQGLMKLGLITRNDQYSIWYTHSSSHWIGIDVHDVGDRDARLEDGMAFTIEPGIYIRQDALDALPKSAENEEFIQKTKSAFNKYKDIGVRIEDSFIMTNGKARQISVGIPRTVDEIESFMKSR